MKLKEHGHKFLVILFLIGALFVHLPDSAIAATTPGQQSTSMSFNLNRCNIWSSKCTTAYMTALYSGETRTSDGNLITTGTVLQHGDNIRLTITENVFYTAAGGYYDTPPSFWLYDLKLGTNYMCGLVGGTCASVSDCNYNSEQKSTRLN